jgi:acyl-CoA thioesterase FadM
MHCAEMTTVQVMIDRSSLRATRIPEDLRAILEQARATLEKAG